MRVDKELANIRLKFAQSAALSSYQKKKYVWKMCYIYMLGYEIDFGHMEMISLLSSTKFQEKSVGYMAVALLIKPGDEMMTLVVNSMRNDIVGNVNFGQTLGLSAVANVGNVDLSEALAADVQRLITDSSSHFNPGSTLSPEIEARNRISVRKKACLCLLKLFRSNPDCVELSEWPAKLAPLLQDRDLGMVTSAIALVLGFAEKDPQDFEVLVPIVIATMDRLVVQKNVHADYTYYKTPSPWLQVRCIQFLRNYRAPFETDKKNMLWEVLKKILIKSDLSSECVNKSNADHSILFEAVGLLIHYGAAESEPRLYQQAMALLGKFISVKDANIRYLGLDSLAMLARQDGPTSVQQHQSTVILALKDADVSVRKRSLELLFLMTDSSNAHTIVDELLVALPSSEAALKEEMVIKIAILAERLQSSLTWYLDTMVQAVTVAGDFVSEDVWFRIIRVVTNEPSIQEYAAEKMIQVVQSKWCHETAVALAAYIIGEFGVNVCEKAGMSGLDQFSALQHHFPRMSDRVQALILTSYAKLINLYPDCRQPITEVFVRLSKSGHLEIQQRSCEYLRLAGGDASLMENVLNVMPAYPERENVLLTKLNATANPEDKKKKWSTEVRSSEGVEAGSESALPVASVGKMVDLLSLDDEEPGASLGVAAPAQTGVTLKPMEEMAVRRLLATLLLLPGQAAVLSDIQPLKVLCIGEFKGLIGRVALAITNAGDGRQPITNLSVAVTSCPSALSMKVSQAPATSLAPEEKTPCYVMVESSRQPFPECPQVTVSFAYNGSAYTHVFEVPVTVCAFADLSAPALAKQAFLDQWKSLDSGSQEAQDVFPAAQSVNASSAARIKSVLFSAMRITPATDIDNANTATGTCAWASNGVLAMIRIEADASSGRYRVTARAKDGVYAVALKNVFKLLLG